MNLGVDKWRGKPSKVDTFSSLEQTFNHARKECSTTVMVYYAGFNINQHGKSKHYNRVFP